MRKTLADLMAILLVGSIPALVGFLVGRLLWPLLSLRRSSRKNAKAKRDAKEYQPERPGMFGKEGADRIEHVGDKTQGE